MLSNYTTQKEICETLIKNLEKINPKDPQIKFWYKELTECQETAIDCAAKAAAYLHPKLESMEVKQTVEHRMVMRAPQKVQSIEEWTKLTGATVAKLEEMDKKEASVSEPAPSIHDYDYDDEDQLETQRRLN